MRHYIIEIALTYMSKGYSSYVRRRVDDAIVRCDARPKADGCSDDADK